MVGRGQMPKKAVALPYFNMDNLPLVEESDEEDLPVDSLHTDQVNKTDEIQRGPETLNNMLNLLKPTNLSVHPENVDFSRAQRITNQTQGDKSMHCSHLSLIENFGFNICVYPDQANKSIIHDRLMDHDAMVSILLRLLKNKELDFIDIGAGVGVFTMAAASLGRRVVSVEPIRANQQCLVKAAQLNRVSNNIVLVPNAISDSHINVTLPFLSGSKNDSSFEDSTQCPPNGSCSQQVPTMTLNDLLPYIPSKRAVLRLDIPGHSMEAIVKTKRFFKRIKVPLIILTWTPYKDTWRAGEEVRGRIGALIKQMLHKKYWPYDANGAVLNVDEWGSWPDTVLWIKRRQ